MRSIKINIFALAGVMLIGLASCGSNDKDKQIAELLDRVSELESSKGTTATATNPSTSTATKAPETKPDGPLPVFEFEEMEHDFGSIKEGDIVEHTFKFTNNGEVPLIIQDAKGSCGCTVPSWSKEPIPVGGEGEITAKYNSKGKSGNENKTITITANTWPAKTTLRIKAQVAKVDDAAGPVQ